MTFGDIWDNHLGGRFFANFWSTKNANFGSFFFLGVILGSFGQPPNANFGDWTLLNDFSWHLGEIKKKFLWQFWPTKNANFGHSTPPIDFWGHLGQTFFYHLLAIFGSLVYKKMQILAIGHLHLTFGDIWDKTKFSSCFGSFFLLRLWHFCPTKNANFGHWTPPNDFWGHLGQNICCWWFLFGFFAV